METRTDIDERGAARAAMPTRVRVAVFAAVAALMLGALYLVSVRGQALLLDLTALSQRVFCF
jgi:uncharacterized membrane protein